MKLRPILLPVLLAGVFAWFLLWRGFTVATVWLVSGGIDQALTRYELWWEGIRMEVLLIVGVMIAGFFIFSLIWWIMRSGEGWKRG